MAAKLLEKRFGIKDVRYEVAGNQNPCDNHTERKKIKWIIEGVEIAINKTNTRFLACPAG